MRTSGFEVALFPYASIVDAFAFVGVNAGFDEDTQDAIFQNAINQIDALSSERRAELKRHLVENNQSLLNRFFNEFQSTLDRQIEQIILIPLHGHQNEFGTIEEAITFVNNYREDFFREGGFRKYEIIVRYSNGDKIEAFFHDKVKAVGFLRYVEEGATA